MTNIVKQFIKKFFKENHRNFYILKTEVNITELIKQLKELIKTLGQSLNIPLRIDSRILKLCESGKDSKERSGNYLKTYFTNEKQQFKELYNRTNRLLTNKNGINMSNLLRISSKSKSNSVELPKELRSEIRLRKFAIECGFETWEQLKNMFRLFKYFYKNGFEKYFDFDSDINNNEPESEINNNNNRSNSENNDNNNNNRSNSKNNKYGRFHFLI